MRFTSILLVLLVATGHASAPWTWVEPRPQGNTLKASAYNAQRDLTVVVGEFGTVMTRSGTGDWQVHQARSAGRLSCITWTGKVFVAGSESGGIFRSLDGVSWSRVKIGRFSEGANNPPSSSGYNFYSLNGDQLISAITTGNGVTVALAGDVVWISSDEERRTWTKHTLPKSTSSWSYYSDLDFGKGLFVAVGTGGSIITSSNGSSWTKRTSGTRRELDYLAFNGTYFVALDSSWTSRSSGEFNATDAQVVRSGNGTAWEKVSPPEWPNDDEEPYFALAAGNKFLLGGVGIWVSDDFLTWTKVSDPSGLWRYYNVLGTGPTSGDRTLIFATAGEVYMLEGSAASLVTEIEGSGLGYGGSVGGLDNLLVGSNNWSALDSVTGTFIDHGSFWASQVFQQTGSRLLGSDGEYQNTKQFALLERNNDSNNWLIKSSAEIPGNIVALAAASSSGPVVCVSRQSISSANDQSSLSFQVYYSSDWSDWELRESYNNVPEWPSPDLQLEHDGERFILLTPDGGLRISAGGRDWNSLPSLPNDTTAFRQRFHGSDNYVPRSNRAAAIASNGQRLVVTSQKIRTEPDGYSFELPSVDGRFFVYDFQNTAAGWREFIAPWASIPEGSMSISWSEAAPRRSMIWTGSRFFAVPQEFNPIRDPQAGRLFASVDAVNWTQHEMPTQVVHVAWTGSQLVAATREGGVLTHPSGLSPEILSDVRIVSQPLSASAYNGEIVTLEVIAQTDLPGLTYQWFKDNKAIRGATKSFYSVKCSSSTLGSYHVAVAATGSQPILSTTATLSMRPAASWSWGDGLPGDQTIKRTTGQPFQLSLVDVQGPPGIIAYQWFKDGTAIRGATGRNLSIANVTAASAGVYTVVITSSAGKATTESRRLVVQDSVQLVYAVKGRSETRQSAGAVKTKSLSGYFVVDRSGGNPRSAFLWTNAVGTRTYYLKEVMEGINMRSTGPGPKTTSAIVLADKVGDFPSDEREVLWISGADTLVRLSNAVSVTAPPTLSGWWNYAGPASEGTTIRTDSISLTLSVPLTLQNLNRNFEETLESLIGQLESKGALPTPAE